MLSRRIGSDTCAGVFSVATLDLGIDSERAPFASILGRMSMPRCGPYVGDRRADARLCPSLQGRTVQVPGAQHKHEMFVTGLLSSPHRSFHSVRLYGSLLICSTLSPRPPSPLPYQNFLTGVTAKSKLPMHLMAPLLDRCEITFVAPPAPVPLSPCTMYTRLDTRVYPCQFTNDHKVLKALCDTWTNLEVSLCSGLFARHSCLPIPISRCRPRRT